MRHYEHKFQSAADVFLRRALPTALHWGTDHAGKRSPLAGMRLKQRGIIPGIADHFTLYKGTLIAWEWKSATGSATEGQTLFSERIQDNDGHYYICRTIEEIERVLRSFGWELRASAQGIDAKLAAHVTKKLRKPRQDKPALSRVRQLEALRAKVLF